MPCRSHVADAGTAFPVLRKDGEGRVSCLGAYVVVDLLERWTGDRGYGRSVALEGQAEIGGGGRGGETMTGRGYRFYHAVLQRASAWLGVMACAPSAAASCSSSAGSCRAQESSRRGTKRRRH
jgi:hypothetical protein